MLKFKSNQQLLEVIVILVILTVAISNGFLNFVYSDTFKDFIVTNKDVEGIRKIAVICNCLFLIVIAGVYSCWSIIRLKYIDASFVLARLYGSLLIVLPFVFPIQSRDFRNENLFYALNITTLYAGVLIFCSFKSGFIDVINERLNAGIAKFRYANGVILVAVVLYVIYFCILTLMRHHDFSSGGFDLGIYSHVFHSLSVGDGSWQTVNYNGDFGDKSNYAFSMTHVSPFYYLLLPFYMLYPKAESLIVIQTIFIAAAVIPLYRLVVLKTDNKILGIVFAISFLLNPAVEKANIFDFHELKFMPFFIFFAFYYLEKNDPWRYLLFMCVVVLIKEDLAIVGLMGGVYYLIRNKNLKFGLYTALAFGLYYFVATRFLLVFTGEGYLFDPLRTEAATGLYGVVCSFVSNPLFILKYITLNTLKVNYWYQQLQIVGFLPLLSPDSLMLMMSTAMVSLFTDSDAFSSIGFQYALYPVPFLYYSAILSISRYIKTNYLYLTAYILLFLAFTQNALNGGISPPASLKARFSHPETRKLLNDMVSAIPDTASVSAGHWVVPHLTERKYIYMFPRIEGAEYILYQNKVNDVWPVTPDSAMKIFSQLILSKQYGVYKYYDTDLFILKKGFVNDSLSNLVLIYDYMIPGSILQQDQYLKSKNGLFTLLMQKDGNLVLYDKESKPMWSSNTSQPNAVTQCVMQADGNIVLYNVTNNTAYWSINTSGNPGARLVLQADGNMVLYKDQKAIWATNTWR